MMKTIFRSTKHGKSFPGLQPKREKANWNHCTGRPLLRNSQNSANLPKVPLVRLDSSMVLPEMFAKHSSCAGVSAAYLLQKYKHLIRCPDQASILEFGFGDGGTSQKTIQQILPQDYAEFIGTDISSQMIEYAEKNTNVPRMKFLKLDIGSEELVPNVNDRFDLICSFFTNHLVRNPKQMFKNIYKMLKPGGQTFQITFERSVLDKVFVNLSKHSKWSKYGHGKVVSPYYYESNPKQTMEKDLINAGFKDIQFRIDESDHEFASQDEWQGLYHSCNPVIPEIPPQEMEEYLRDYFAIIQRETLVEDDNLKGTNFFKVNFRMYSICATKDK